VESGSGWECERTSGLWLQRPASGRIPRSRESSRGAADDDERVDAFVLRAALAVLGIAVLLWIALSAATLVGRLRYDRSHERKRSERLSARTAERLVRRVRRKPRSEWGRWRRVLALQRLGRARHPAVPGLVRYILDDPDARVASAAIRTLGDIGDDWATETLIDALRRGSGSRSRVAAELEELAPAPGERLLPLLRDWNPAVRFWGATLLHAYPDLGEATLIELTWDQDPNVRAAAVETLGSRSGKDVGTALVARLDDGEWFVRVHAARAAGQVVGAEAAPSLAQLLADERWWVRTASKDALRGIGVDAVPALLSVLGHEDRFARNGAAEVLQDVGFVDFLALDSPHSPLLERIFAAGGDRYRDAAETRLDDLAELEAEEAAEEARVA
jgi:HEAT repeat protein